MATNADVACLVPYLAGSLQRLSDAELLAGVRGLVGRSNRLLAELLAHLAEVEARGIHRIRACSSLYTYCIYELRLSEDEAFRRVAAARLVRRFPALFDALASGELHLTGLLMLGPHLTEENLMQVLARAKHRTKRELACFVRVLDPLPAVPARIEPLGPAPARVVPGTPTWEQFAQATAPVRELPPGDRPRDWLQGANDDGDGAPCDRADVGAAPRAAGPEPTPGAASDQASAPARELTEPQRYKVQFTATEEYVQLVEEAKALLSHAVPNATLDDIQLRALRAFVAGLKQQKYAAAKASNAVGVDPEGSESDQLLRAEATGEPTHPRRRGRHIPAAVRRAVANRDGERCSYVDATGRRCAETHRLEFHHLKPFATGGQHTTANLSLRCRAHNSLAAEDDFGAERIAANKAASPHEPFSKQPPRPR